MDNNVRFSLNSLRKMEIEELKNLTAFPGSYTYYLGLFVVRDKFVQR